MRKRSQIGIEKKHTHSHPGKAHEIYVFGENKGPISDEGSRHLVENSIMREVKRNAYFTSFQLCFSAGSNVSSDRRISNGFSKFVGQ